MKTDMDGRCDNVVSELARELHWQMERLDPTDLSEWDELSERQRKFYRNCVEHLLLQEALLLEYLQMPAPRPPRGT